MHGGSINATFDQRLVFAGYMPKQGGCGLILKFLILIRFKSYWNVGFKSRATPPALIPISFLCSIMSFDFEIILIKYAVWVINLFTAGADY